MHCLTEQELKLLANQAGLHVTGITDLTPLSDAGKSLNIWQERGFAGEMHYMGRPRELLAAPAALMPQGGSVICFAIYYDRGPRINLKPGMGRIARYAWGQDYHIVLKARLEGFVKCVESVLNRKINARIFTDAVPTLERALAQRSGIGFQGKNTMLIRRGGGSFFFLGEILWDLKVDQSGKIDSASCGSCQKCLDTCPTGALVEPYVLDARKCISYLTIEKRGILDGWERKAIGEWVFGCDICQECCPFNHAALKAAKGADIEELSKGSGPFLDLKSVISIRSNEAFLLRFKGTALLRPRRENLIRNCLIVAGNTSAFALEPDILETLEGDPSEIVRAHALFALAAMSQSAGMPVGNSARKAIEQALNDPSEAVQNAAGGILSQY